MAIDTHYAGNAGIGLGGNADIPAIDGAALNVINQTGRDLMLLNHENNLKIYDQKIKDRNKQLELIDSGQVATGNILDKDRPVIKGYQDAANKEFETFVKSGGMNNPEAFRKYQNKITELKDAVTHAQYRWTGSKELEKEKAAQPIKTFQDDYAKHIAGEDSKGFWDGDYSPYQHSLTLDIDAINKKAVKSNYDLSVNDKGVADPNGLFRKSGTNFDYGKTKSALTDAYLEGKEDMFNQQELLKNFDEMEPQKKLEKVNEINTAIDKHNAKYGLIEGTSPDFVKHIEVSPKSGQIAENPVDFATKWVLASQSDTETIKKDEKAAELALKTQTEKDKVQNDKAKIGVAYAKLALDKVKFKDESSLKWYEAKQKLKNNEDKGVWVNDQTTSIIKNAKAGKKEETGDFAGMYKTTSKALTDLFTETKKSGTTITKIKPDAIYINDQNEAIPVYKGEAGAKMSADELKSKIAETQFGKNAQSVLDASNQVLENTVGGSSLNDNVDNYYDVRNTKNVPKQQDQIPVYTQADLLQNGWTDAQIKAATKAGKIKIK